MMLRVGFAALGAAALLLVPAPLAAKLDLSRAQVAHLDNGLTVIVLEDHSLPVVSVQALYKVGSRDEAPGKAGLAHFLEHLAFRGSENFPDAAATDAIYDAGGEWHGYTWLDQTTYYATMPKSGLDLLLRIEADRMARVTIDDAAMAAEAGAVITEMHGYENNPGDVLLDAVAGMAFQAHPYRIPTIGYEADVAALKAADAHAFYRAHYAPDNAVLAIVGDISAPDVLAQVKAAFGAIPRGPGAHRTPVSEPRQTGERRLVIAGPAERSHLKIAWPAPAASSPDFPAFLLLQQLLAGGSGINFDQNDWGAPAEPGTPLAGLADDLSTWFIPSAEPYIFTVSASVDPTADRDALEAAIEANLGAAREAAPSAAKLADARTSVRKALAFDVGTTEDAAHQLAYFEGLGALGMLFALDAGLDAVTPEDVMRVARTYLTPEQRTIGWYVPGDKAAAPRPGEGTPRSAGDRPHGQVDGATAGEPMLRTLSGGLPAIVQSSSLSPTVSVRVALSAPDAAEGEAVVRSGMAGELPRLLAEARDAVVGASPADGGEPSMDPSERLEQAFAAAMGQRGGTPGARVVAVSGDVDPSAVFATLERGFGAVPPVAAAVPHAVLQGELHTVSETIPLPLAQAALGYLVPAPPPGTREGLAWRAQLYVLTHEYGGRLGDEAIKRRGLTYYVDSDYRLVGGQGWIVLGTGVDPGKIDAMEAALRSELARLARDPPSAAELDKARRHILGRDVSAAQSNEELAGKLARSWLETGGLPDDAALAAALDELAPADLAAAAEPFGRGTIFRIDVAPAQGQNSRP